MISQGLAGVSWSEWMQVGKCLMLKYEILSEGTYLFELGCDWGRDYIRNVPLFLTQSHFCVTLGIFSHCNFLVSTPSLCAHIAAPRDGFLASTCFRFYCHKQHWTSSFLYSHTPTRTCIVHSFLSLSHLHTHAHRASLDIWRYCYHCSLTLYKMHFPRYTTFLHTSLYVCLSRCLTLNYLKAGALSYVSSFPQHPARPTTQQGHKEMFTKWKRWMEMQ